MEEKGIDRRGGERRVAGEWKGRGRRFLAVALCLTTFGAMRRRSIACLIAGATNNAYRTKYRHVIYAQNWTCESPRKGVFIAGAVFVVFTMILNAYYYVYFAEATSHAAGKTIKANSTVGMAGYA